ncbi:hypothetical protein F0562_006773 [Nyssa sinensis]|uniref:Auxin efflux carrier n=1 Tax=Nyssa sinensis TaxID=561372 RepID=A0A5J5ALX9_9ASTE|nr:hypothetical protein F0562_006773 [Nyssa sinensis]
MGFLTLLEVASMPMLQVIIITILGAFLATDYLNLLPAPARKSLNKIVFVVFTPALMFSSLAATVTLEDIISWWFMPVNIGLTFLFGGILGWITVKLLKVESHLEGLVIATCSAGNLGNILLILVPAICKESGSPFGAHDICESTGLSYASFSMALGAFYIWTYAYQLCHPRNPLKRTQKIKLLCPKCLLASWRKNTESFQDKLKRLMHQILDALLEPPTVGAIVGFIFGAIPWLKNLLIGDTAPLRVIQDSIELLGNGTIPCITLILGGNLIGIGKAKIKPSTIIAILLVRYVILPGIGIGVIKAATEFGFLPSDPLYHFMLMIQFSLPPAMSIGTMAQLFDVGQEECSVLMLWTYLCAAPALTVWSTVYMWILS